LRELASVVNRVLSVICLGEHDLVALGLSSDDETSNSVFSSSEDTVLVNAEVKLHVALLTSLLVPSGPKLLSIHLKSERVRHALEIPSALNGSSNNSSSIVDGVLALVLLDKADVAGRSNLTGESERSDLIGTASNNTTADVDLEVVEAHLVLASPLAVVTLPANNFVRHLTP
jgi:hypothetical protein